MPLSFDVAVAYVIILDHISMSQFLIINTVIPYLIRYSIYPNKEVQFN